MRSEEHVGDAADGTGVDRVEHEDGLVRARLRERVEMVAEPLVRHRDHLDALAAAGADEAILVLDPIDAGAVGRVADVLF